MTRFLMGVLLFSVTTGCAHHAPASRRPAPPSQQQPIVSLIEYSDFQCPFAAEAFEQIICSELRKAVAVDRGNSAQAEEPDCWTLVQPDWKRLEELDRGEIVPPSSR
jgi:hypothetical protein